MKASNPAHIAPPNYPVSRVTQPPALSRPRPLAPLTQSCQSSPPPFREFVQSRTIPPPPPVTPSLPLPGWARRPPRRRLLQRPSISQPRSLPCHHRPHRLVRSLPISFRVPHPIPSLHPLPLSSPRSSPPPSSPARST